MVMKLRLAAILAMLVVLATSAVVSAHANYRIIGTVMRVTPTRLDVKQTKDGAIISMEMDEESIVTRDKKKLSRAVLKVGLHVVVDACGDSLKDLVVMEVKLVPPPPGKVP
jgi:hypothetical protein